MIKRFVVCSRQKEGEGEEEEQRTRRSTAVGDIAILLLALAFIQWQRGQPIDRYYPKLFDIFLIIFLLYYLRPRKKANLERTVTMYPLGVQLSGPTGTPRFLPRDVVVDCVVTEVILAHKVISVVIFRVKGRNGTTELVDAFPGMDMTYVECLTVRSKIMDCLQDSSSRQTTANS
jgi:hypothetical protein